jgi:hypothetical protein
MEVVTDVWNKQLQTADKGGPPALGLGKVLTTPHCKELACYRMLHRALEMDTLFGMT